jgi:regulatory protein
VADLTGPAIAALEFAKELIARREHSVFELRRKLHQRGYAAAAEAVIDSLTRAGLLDDERYARAWVAVRTGRKTEGRRRLVAELIKRGVRDTVAEAVVAEELPVAKEQELLRSSAAALRAGGHSRNAIARRLLARGFPPAAVRRITAMDSGGQ